MQRLAFLVETVKIFYFSTCDPGTISEIKLCKKGVVAVQLTLTMLYNSKKILTVVF